MATRTKDHSERGVTLVELLVALGIIGILVIAGGFQYQGWVGRYRVESEVKRMYSDLMNARSMALSRSRMFFINVPAGDDKRYRVFEDTYDSGGGKDGDQELTAEDEETVNVVTTYSLSPKGNRHLVIDNKGMITNGTGILVKPEYIVFETDGSLDPDYDCIELAATRINMGLWDDATSICVTK